MAQTAAIRAARTAESALLRSASSWSMASATRRRADSSIEHTIEDYQLGDVLRARLPKLGYPQVADLCLWKLDVDHPPGNPPEVFFRTAGGSRFPCSRGSTCG